MGPLVPLAGIFHEAVIERTGQDAIKFCFDNRLTRPACETPLEGTVLQILEAILARGITLEQLEDKRGFHGINDNFPQMLVIEIAKRGPTRPLPTAYFLPLAAPNVLGQIVDIIFALAKGDLHHKFPLRGVLKPKGGKFKKFYVAGVEEIYDPATINTISGEAIWMPSDNPVRLALFDSDNHVIENGAAGDLGCLRLGKLLLDGQFLLLGKKAKLSELSFNGEHLSLFAISGFSGVQKKGWRHNYLPGPNGQFALGPRLDF